VELDLEGAPFLEPDPAPSPQVQATRDEHEDAPPPPSKSSKKILIPVVLLLLILAGGAAYFFLFMGQDQSTPPPAPPGVEVVVIPSTPPAPPPAQVSARKIEWAPFWVALMDPEGEIRFIYCQFTLLMENPRIASQVESKNLTLRDAVYYFLRHKSYGELADVRRLEGLKAELLNIINYYILPEQAQKPGPDGVMIPEVPPRYERVEDILLVDYLVK
jgi:flagellar FliL protein